MKKLVCFIVLFGTMFADWKESWIKAEQCFDTDQVKAESYLTDAIIQVDNRPELYVNRAQVRINLDKDDLAFEDINKAKTLKMDTTTSQKALFIETLLYARCGSDKALDLWNEYKKNLSCSPKVTEGDNYIVIENAPDSEVYKNIIEKASSRICEPGNITWNSNGTGIIKKK